MMSISQTLQDQQSYPFSRRAQLASGQPIGKLMAEALRYPHLVSLAAGFVDRATLPCGPVERCLKKICDNPALLTRALQYDATAGNADLRECIAQWSYQAAPDTAPDPEHVILTSGSNQFLHLLADCIIDPGDIVIAAAPTYFVFLGTLKGVDARVIGVRADESGMCMDALEEKLMHLSQAGLAGRVKAIYTVTEFDNPAGSTLSLERRERLLQIVARWRREHGPLLILSDNAYELLRYQGEALPKLTSLAPEASQYVVELGTFSKCFSPGIRVGWGVVPSYLIERLLELKSNADFGSPHLSQVLMLEALNGGEVDSHLPTIRKGYKEKLDAMLDALTAAFENEPDVSWRSPAGGLYVWLQLPCHIDTSESGPLWKAATDRGVLYVPGHYCYPEQGEAVAKNTIRLSFGVQCVESIKDGIHKLAAAYRDVLHSP